jgi:hypothetical protein
MKRTIQKKLTLRFEQKTICDSTQSVKNYMKSLELTNPYILVKQVMSASNELYKAIMVPKATDDEVRQEAFYIMLREGPIKKGLFILYFEAFILNIGKDAAKPLVVLEINFGFI